MVPRRPRHRREVIDRAGGWPALVTRHPSLMAALVPVAESDLEDFVLANAPEFVAAAERLSRVLLSDRAARDLRRIGRGPERRRLAQALAELGEGRGRPT